MDERLRQDLPIVAALVAVAIAGVLVFDVLARFSYTLTERTLVMRWWILGYVPFGWLTIAFDDIVEAHAGYRPNLLHIGGYLFGSLFKKGVITLVLRTRTLRLSVGRRCYITPDESRAFLAKLRRRLAQRPGR